MVSAGLSGHLGQPLGRASGGAGEQHFAPAVQVCLQHGARGGGFAGARPAGEDHHAAAQALRHRLQLRVRPGKVATRRRCLRAKASGSSGSQGVDSGVAMSLRRLRASACSMM